MTNTQQGSEKKPDQWMIEKAEKEYPAIPLAADETMYDSVQMTNYQRDAYTAGLMEAQPLAAPSSEGEDRETVNIAARKAVKKKMDLFSGHRFSDLQMTSIGFDMFLAGYDHHAAKPQPAPNTGGVWVKASERLPGKEYSFGGDEFGCFPVRWNFEYRTVLGIGYFNEKTNSVYNASNTKPFPEDIDLEWLDESQSPSTDIEVMRKALETIADVTVQDSYEEALIHLKSIARTALSQSPAESQGKEAKAEKSADLGECHECHKRPAVKDYNGHSYFVCERCYSRLSDEFEDEYR